MLPLAFCSYPCAHHCACTGFRQSVIRVLQLYKERFVNRLSSSSDKANANFGRPVFLAVAFSLVARKNKVCLGVVARALLPLPLAMAHLVHGPSNVRLLQSLPLCLAFVSTLFPD